jgi:hypothetical protein
MDEGALRVPAHVTKAHSPTAGRRLARLELRRSWSSLAAALVSCVVLVKLAFSAGGYFPTGYLPAGVLAYAALAVVLVVHIPSWTFPTSGLLALASLAGLGAWTGLSATWSPDPAAAIGDLQRDAVYVALFALGLVAAGSGRHARLLPWAVLAVITIVIGAGLLSRLEPDLVHGTIQDAGFTQGRLSYPLSYWNTFGALAGMGLVLAAGLASDAGAPVVARAVAAGLAVPLGAAMWFSLSRGAWLAVIVGLVMLVVVGHRRGSVVITLVVIGTAIALAITRLDPYPSLTGDLAGVQFSASDGHAYLAQLALISAACGALVGVIAAGRASANLMQAGGRALRPLATVAGGVLLVAAIGVYAARSSTVEGVSAERSTGASSWLSKQWHDFLAPASFSAGGSARLTTAKGTRSDLYRVALDGFKAHPLQGDGAGGFQPRWYRERRVTETVNNAHSLEIETLGELGLVGALLLLGFLVAVGAAVVRSRRRPGSMGRAQTAAVAAALSVWLVHAAVDWDWQMPALTGTAMLLASSVFPYGRRRGRRASAKG